MPLPERASSPLSVIDAIVDAAEQPSTSSNASGAARYLDDRSRVAETRRACQSGSFGGAAYSVQPIRTMTIATLLATVWFV